MLGHRFTEIFKFNRVMKKVNTIKPVLVKCAFCTSSATYICTIQKRLGLLSVINDEPTTSTQSPTLDPMKVVYTSLSLSVAVLKVTIIKLEQQLDNFEFMY